MTEFFGPADQSTICVEIARKPPQGDVVHWSRDVTGEQQSLFGNHLRSKMLKVARSDRASQHVQQLEMSRRVLTTSKLRVERTCKSGNITGVKRKDRFGHRLSSLMRKTRRSISDCQCSPASDSARDKCPSKKEEWQV